MRRLFLFLLLLLAVAPSAQAAGIGTNRVDADSVYIRPKPQSWAIGTLYRGEAIDIQEVTPGGWAYGYVYGSFNGCAWVDASYVKLADRDRANTCPTDAATRQPAEPQMFSEWSDPAKPDGVEWHTVDCAPAGATRSAYGNYRGDFRNKYGEIPVNSGIDWRYTTRDGQAAMVKNTANTVGAPAWFFIPRACIAPGKPAPASTPPPPPSGGGGAPPPATPPGKKAKKRKKVCWKTSKSRYCKKLRRACRKRGSHSARCRRALRGKKKRRSRAASVSASRADRMRVKRNGNDVTVRNAPPGPGAGYVIGNARKGVAFDMVGSANGMRHGFVHGNLKRCGWIFPQNLNDVAERPRRRCGAGATHRYSFRSFSNGQRNCQPRQCSGGSGARIDYQQPGCAATGQAGRAYANVNPFLARSKPRDFYGTLPDETLVFWRYVSRDGQWVMVHDKKVTKNQRAGFPRAASDWYFVSNRCLRRL